MAARSWTTPCLITVIAIQWVLFSVLLQQRYSSQEQKQLLQSSSATFSSSSALTNNSTATTIVNRRTRQEKIPLEGVAVTVIFKAPKWMHLRYLLTIHNALANLPDQSGSWKVQLFVNQHWADANLLPWHPGIQRIFRGQDPRVIVTPLTMPLTKGKPKQVLFSKWFWESMAADRVVLFSANGAFCGNLVDHHAWDQLLLLDYCGAPWTNHHGVGGDGSSHSIRSRPAMLKVIEYANANGKPLQDNSDFVNTMIRMNNDETIAGDQKFKIATPEQTIQFGGVYNLSSGDDSGLVRMPIAVAGTQARLTYSERDSLLKHCPELKTIFPSLHEPSCFGAHPNPVKCKATICALQDDLPAHGC